MSRSSPAPDPPPRNLDNLSRVVASAMFMLTAATYRLWTPQTVFPQVPFIAALGSAPRWLEWAGLGVMLAGLIMGLCGGRSRVGRAGILLFVASMTGLVLLDQHRLQPWAYQLGLASLVLACTSDRSALRLLRVLTISVYFYSAASKIDLAFIDGIGGTLLEAFLSAIGLTSKWWTPRTLFFAGASMPVVELATSGLLAFRRTRRYGLVLSILMHAALLIALGPWGLDNQPAVLIWNAFFVVQNVLLFGSRTSRAAATAKVAGGKVCPTSRWAAGVACFASAAAVVLPLLEPFGWFDHWPAWAVYSERSEKVRVLVDDDLVNRLPPSWKTYVGPARPRDGLRPIRIDRWSLDALRAPLYPQDRFEIGVAIAVVEAVAGSDGVTLEVGGPPDRRTGRRDWETYRGAAAIRSLAKAFRLNATPR